MPATFTFELVSPERLLVSETVDAVTLPATGGDMTILGDHAPVMTTLRPGVLSVTTEGGQARDYVVFGGFADVTTSGLTVLAEDASNRDEVNREALAERIARARADHEEATQTAGSATAGGQDRERANRAEDYLNQLTTLEGAILPA